MTRVNFKRWYVCVDYEGNALPTLVMPLKTVGKHKLLECMNEKGGVICVKRSELVHPPLDIDVVRRQRRK